MKIYAKYLRRHCKNNTKPQCRNRKNTCQYTSKRQNTTKMIFGIC